MIKKLLKSFSVLLLSLTMLLSCFYTIFKSSKLAFAEETDKQVQLQDLSNKSFEQNNVDSVLPSLLDKTVSEELSVTVKSDVVSAGQPVIR